jgi:hypothetical protein
MDDFLAGCSCNIARRCRLRTINVYLTAALAAKVQHVGGQPQRVAIHCPSSDLYCDH